MIFANKILEFGDIYIVEYGEKEYLLECRRPDRKRYRRQCGHARRFGRSCEIHGVFTDARVSLSARAELAEHEAPWLILPVVICLSQRLSHACLSACRIKVKPRMAH